jgi:hypothetical protein
MFYFDFVYIGKNWDFLGQEISIFPKIQNKVEQLQNSTPSNLIPKLEHNIDSPCHQRTIKHINTFLMVYILDGKFGRYNSYLQFSFDLVIYVRNALIPTCAYVLPTLYNLVYVK